MMEHFQFSQEVAVLTVSLFVAGVPSLPWIPSSLTNSSIKGIVLDPSCGDHYQNRYAFSSYNINTFTFDCLIVWSKVRKEYVLQLSSNKINSSLRPMFIIAFLGYTGFQVGDALAPNTAALLVFRLLGGTFAAW
jgi:hypothetical protein